MPDLQTLMGLVGCALVVSVGPWLETPRDWLRGFTIWANPLRLLGEAMSSTLCAGFCVGFAWGLAGGAANGSLVGGLVAVSAHAADEGLALMHAIVRKIMPVAMPPMPMPRGDGDARTASELVNRPLSEEEAHLVVDAREDLK